MLAITLMLAELACDVGFRIMGRLWHGILAKAIPCETLAGTYGLLIVNWRGYAAKAKVSITTISLMAQSLRARYMPFWLG